MLKALGVFLPHYLMPFFRILNRDKERNEASSYFIGNPNIWLLCSFEPLPVV